MKSDFAEIEFLLLWTTVTSLKGLQLWKNFSFNHKINQTAEVVNFLKPIFAFRPIYESWLPFETCFFNPK